MRINIVRKDTSTGLTRSGGILAEVLGAAGAEVTITAAYQHGRENKRLRRLARLYAKTTLSLAPRVTARELARVRGRLPIYDANIFLEQIEPGWIAAARANYFVPNPECWDTVTAGALGRVDAVLCKTRHALPIFDGLGCHTRFIGFTSREPRAQAPADAGGPLRFLHLSGEGKAKGTAEVIEAWRRHPEWPTLTIVGSHRKWLRSLGQANVQLVGEFVSDAQLAELQASHPVHLVPSRYEGFGHRVNEALAVGALCVTTDAAPMNELVTAERGVLLAASFGPIFGLVPAASIAPGDFDAAIETVIAMPAEERRARAAAGRASYLENDRAFRARIADAVLGADAVAERTA